MCEEYTFDATLHIFHVAVQDVLAFTDALYDASYTREGIDWQQMNDGSFVVEVNEAVFENDDFENALIDSELLDYVLDCEFSCTGQGQKTFFRVQDGQLQISGTIQQPDGNWKAVERRVMPLYTRSGIVPERK